MKNAFKFYDPKNYVLAHRDGTWCLTTTQLFKLEHGDAGFHFVIKEEYMKPFVNLLIGPSAIHIEHSGNRINLIFKDKHLNVVGVIPADIFRAVTLHENLQYDIRFVTLVVDLLAQNDQYYNQHSPIDKLYNPKDYVLQCDWEDDSFMVFSTGEFDDTHGQKGFNVALTQNRFEMLLDNLRSKTIAELHFDVNDRRLGVGTLRAVTNEPEITLKLPCEGFGDVDRSTSITDPERIDLICKLLDTLYKEEFPEKQEQPHKNSEVQKNDNIEKLNTMKKDMEWLLDRYGDGWGYMKRSAYGNMISMIDAAIESEGE